MPTRRISEREKLTIFARTASNDELDQALEILRVESSVRKAGKAPKKAGKPAAVPPGPPNPPKPANDNPQGERP